MDALDEAGLDLELEAFGKRLDSRLISRGWRRRAPGGGTDFELSARRCDPGRLRLRLDAALPEAVARQIMTLAVRHGLKETQGEAGQG